MKTRTLTILLILSILPLCGEDYAKRIAYHFRESTSQVFATDMSSYQLAKQTWKDSVNNLPTQSVLDAYDRDVIDEWFDSLSKVNAPLEASEQALDFIIFQLAGGKESKLGLATLMDMLKRLSSPDTPTNQKIKLAAVNAWIEKVQAEARANPSNPDFTKKSIGPLPHTYLETYQ